MVGVGVKHGQRQLMLAQQVGVRLLRRIPDASEVALVMALDPKGAGHVVGVTGELVIPSVT